jgi:hypothetical protein
MGSNWRGRAKQISKKRAATATEGEEWEDGLSSLSTGRTMVHSGRGYCSCTSVALGRSDDWSKGNEKAGLWDICVGVVGDW